MDRRDDPHLILLCPEFSSIFQLYRVFLNRWIFTYFVTFLVFFESISNQNIDNHA